ncbi:MAG: phage tail protein [Proteobacteria bacterium]|nr:phage tail protein [Pseudomonadota bacterium]
MSEYYVAQIMMTGFPFAQRQFAQCNGQLLSIQQNAALFSLLGTYYGGNGVQNFALPDMRSRTPVGQGSSSDSSWQPTPYPIGMVAGTENVTLLTSQMPMHNHLFTANTGAGTAANPNGGLFAQAAIQGGGQENIYTPTAGGTVVPLAPSTVGPSGGGTPHANLQPYLCINFNIALSGIFPSRN